MKFYYSNQSLHTYEKTNHFLSPPNCFRDQRVQ